MCYTSKKWKYGNGCRSILWRQDQFTPWRADRYLTNVYPIIKGATYKFIRVIQAILPSLVSLNVPTRMTSDTRMDCKCAKGHQ